MAFILNKKQNFQHFILIMFKAVVAIFTALAAWSVFMGPLLYLQREELYPHIGGNL
jgi:ABC-type glycerol-3-phosphate transport system permease component